jgi:hypothetical protein
MLNEALGEPPCDWGELSVGKVAPVAGETTADLARRFHGLLADALAADDMSAEEIASMLASAVRDGGH